MPGTVGRLLARLDVTVPPGPAAADDPGGLQIGDPDAAAGRVGICHEVSEDVVAAAVGARLDLLVTYHPLLFSPTVRLVAGRSAGGRAWRLAAAGVAVAVVHTAFDVTDGGTADALADALGIRGAEAFGLLPASPTVKIVTFVPAEAVDRVVAALGDAGAGTIGNYTGCSFRSPGVGTFVPGPGTSPYAGRPGVPETVDEIRVEMVAPVGREAALVAALRAAHPYEEPAFDVSAVRGGAGLVGRVGEVLPVSLARFGAAVGEALASPGTRVSGSLDRLARRVAVVPGSGSSFVADAAAAGAHVLVTGDMSHHRTVEALDRGVAVVDPGHASTERPGMARLVSVVADAAAGAEIVDLTHLDPTPWVRPAGERPAP